MSIWDVANYFKVDQLVTLVECARNGLTLDEAQNLRSFELLQRKTMLNTFTSALNSLYDPQGAYHKRPDVEEAFRLSLLSVVLCLKFEPLGKLFEEEKFRDFWRGYEPIVVALIRRSWILPKHASAANPTSTDLNASLKLGCLGRTCDTEVVDSYKAFVSPFHGMLPLEGEGLLLCDYCWRFLTLEDWQFMKEYKDKQQETNASSSSLRKILLCLPF